MKYLRFATNGLQTELTREAFLLFEIKHVLFITQQSLDLKICLFYTCSFIWICQQKKYLRLKAIRLCKRGHIVFWNIDRTVKSTWGSLPLHPTEMNIWLCILLKNTYHHRKMNPNGMFIDILQNRFRELWNCPIYIGFSKIAAEYYTF